MKMVDDMYDVATYALYLICAIFLTGIGMSIGMPNELENGCIVHNDKIYCEEGNNIGVTDEK